MVLKIKDSMFLNEVVKYMFIFIFSMFFNFSYAASTIRVGYIYDELSSHKSTLGAIRVLVEDKGKTLLDRKLELIVFQSYGMRDFDSGLKELILDKNVDVVFVDVPYRSFYQVKETIASNKTLVFYVRRHPPDVPWKNVFYTGSEYGQLIFPVLEYFDGEFDFMSVHEALDIRGYTINQILEDYSGSQHQFYSNQDFKIRQYYEVPFDIKNRSKYLLLDKFEFNTADLPSSHSSDYRGVISFDILDYKLNSFSTTDIGNVYFVSNSHRQPGSEESSKLLGQLNSRATNKDDKVLYISEVVESIYLAFNIWVDAVEKAHTLSIDSVRQKAIGIKVKNLSGGVSEVMNNHHITKPVIISDINGNIIEYISSKKPCPKKPCPRGASCTESYSFNKSKEECDCGKGATCVE